MCDEDWILRVRLIFPASLCVSLSLYLNLSLVPHHDDVSFDRGVQVVVVVELPELAVELVDVVTWAITFPEVLDRGYRVSDLSSP